MSDAPASFPDRTPVEAAMAAAGGGAELARKLGLSRWAPHQWKQVPAERVAEVSRITGIPRHDLRPDIYEPPTHAEDAA